MDQTLFQYCQKLVLLSPDLDRILLAKRTGEADYDDVYSFIGGKMETADESMLAGMKREKDEEIGDNAIVRVLPDESYNFFFRKKDGNSMILPHIAGVYVSGDIRINDEYSTYAWIPIAEIDAFEPKIANIPHIARWAATKIAASRDQLVEI